MCLIHFLNEKDIVNWLYHGHSHSEKKDHYGYNLEKKKKKNSATSFCYVIYAYKIVNYFYCIVGMQYFCQQGAEKNKDKRKTTVTIITIIKTVLLS